MRVKCCLILVGHLARQGSSPENSDAGSVLGKAVGSASWADFSVRPRGPLEIWGGCLGTYVLCKWHSLTLGNMLTQ